MGKCKYAFETKENTDMQQIENREKPKRTGQSERKTKKEKKSTYDFRIYRAGTYEKDKDYKIYVYESLDGKTSTDTVSVTGYIYNIDTGEITV